MSTRISTTAALIAAATALAAGAYTLGTQSDGSAVAAKDTATPYAGGGWQRGGPPGSGFSDLASRLGVSEAKLRVALQELRGSQPGDLGAEHAALVSSLAASLKVSEAEVKAAFNAVRRQDAGRGARRFGRGPADLAAGLAKQLGVSQAKVETALQNAVQTDQKSHIDELAGTLATALKLDKAKVAAAIESLRPATGARPRDRRPDQGLAAALAKKLGVAPGDVRSALQAVRSTREQQMSAERDAFATKLADKLGISADKVKSVLSDHGPFGLHPGRGGPGPRGPFRHP
ncbi:MAG: hypothetical protein QOK21_7 [Solirubrobacteraceae bacterium]|jgi:hypothetical protein|nr:hypothetical protein [Solirubrobacteraceae bacterium]